MQGAFVFLIDVVLFLIGLAETTPHALTDVLHGLSAFFQLLLRYSHGTSARDHSLSNKTEIGRRDKGKPPLGGRLEFGGIIIAAGRQRPTAAGLSN